LNDDTQLLGGVVLEVAEFLTCGFGPALGRSPKRACREKLGTDAAVRGMLVSW